MQCVGVFTFQIVLLENWCCGLLKHNGETIQNAACQSLSVQCLSRFMLVSAVGVEIPFAGWQLVGRWAPRKDRAVGIVFALKTPWTSSDTCCARTTLRPSPWQVGLSGLCKVTFMWLLQFSFGKVVCLPSLPHSLFSPHVGSVFSPRI